MRSETEYRTYPVNMMARMLICIFLSGLCIGLAGGFALGLWLA